MTNKQKLEDKHIDNFIHLTPEEFAEFDRLRNIPIGESFNPELAKAFVEFDKKFKVIK